MALRRRQTSWLVLPILFAGFSTGCRNCQLVEAELRFQTDRVQELENQVILKDAEITTLSTTVLALRDELKERGNAPPPESIFRNMGLAKINLGPLTGGRDLDNDGRPDAIEVVVVPIDFDDDPFKCPGSAEVEVFQIETNGLKKPIGHWLIDEERLRESWRVTVMGQGFQIVEPWQTLPVTGNLRVLVRFTTLDGRDFEAERDVPISMAQKVRTDTGASCEVSPNAVSISKRPPKLGDPSLFSKEGGPKASEGATPAAQSRIAPRYTASGKLYVSPAAAWQSKRGSATGAIVLPIPAEAPAENPPERHPWKWLPDLPLPRFHAAEKESQQNLRPTTDVGASTSAAIPEAPAVRLLAPLVLDQP